MRSGGGAWAVDQKNSSSPTADRPSSVMVFPVTASISTSAGMPSILYFFISRCLTVRSASLTELDEEDSSNGRLSQGIFVFVFVLNPAMKRTNERNNRIGFEFFKERQ